LACDGNVTRDSESEVPKTLLENKFQYLLSEQLVHAPVSIHTPFSTIDQRLTKMPFFDPQDADALTSENLDVAQIFDLKGLGAVEALAVVEAALRDMAAKDEVKLLFSFPPPVPGAGETLFQPVGRRLRDAIKAGIAVRAMPAQGGGWIVRLAPKAS
jgi:hypothetical protein